MKRAKNNSTNAGMEKGVGKKEVRTDALAVRNNIIANERVAAKFFFVEMLPKMAALADSYNRSFGLDIKAEDVACTTYLSCWENDWAKLRAFNGDTTTHAWVAKIASQATYKMLVEEKYIADVAGCRASDYRLTVLSIDDDFLRREIVRMVYVPNLYMALMMKYVWKLTDDVAAWYFGGCKEAADILKEAEISLIEQLLNTENPFAEMALSLKKTINPEVQFQTWHDRIDDADVAENISLIRDILARLYSNEDWDTNVVRFINSIVAEMEWTEMQEEVWRERFFNETSSKELALRFHVRNTWIDNTYSRLNKQFRIAVKTWWDKYNR